MLFRLCCESSFFSDAWRPTKYAFRIDVMIDSLYMPLRLLSSSICRKHIILGDYQTGLDLALQEILNHLRDCYVEAGYASLRIHAIVTNYEKRPGQALGSFQSRKKCALAPTSERNMSKRARQSTGTTATGGAGPSAPLQAGTGTSR